MTILYYVALVLHIAAALFLIGVVLLQQGKGQDLASAFGGGGTQTAFGPRGSATVLSRATTILAALFMLTSLTLSLVPRQSRSFLDEATAPSAQTTATKNDSAPAAKDAGAKTESPAATPESSK
jgi:preprotein translocase subunit SecG